MAERGKPPTSLDLAGDQRKLAELLMREGARAEISAEPPTADELMPLLRRFYEFSAAERRLLRKEQLRLSPLSSTFHFGRGRHHGRTSYDRSILNSVRSALLSLAPAGSIEEQLDYLRAFYGDSGATIRYLVVNKVRSDWPHTTDATIHRYIRGILQATGNKRKT